MIRCLIIDDEAPARNLIRLHLSNLKTFDIIGSMNSAPEALMYLQKHAVDLVFLDIHMPKMSGLELARSMTGQPKVILTTAYREYAAEAFEIDVFDYLVKPITQERFMKAMSKFIQYWDTRHEVSEASKSANDAFIFLKVGREQVKIFLKDILFIEGLVDYTRVHTVNSTYIASEKLGFMQETLPTHAFVRIHKSFIIAINQITSYNADQVFINKKPLPLGRLFKTAFLKAVQQKN